MAGKIPPFKLTCIAIIISFGGAFHFGYQIVVTNPSQNAFLNFYNRSHVAHYGWIMTPNTMKVYYCDFLLFLKLSLLFQQRSDYQKFVINVSFRVPGLLLLRVYHMEQLLVHLQSAPSVQRLEERKAFM